VFSLRSAGTGSKSCFEAPTALPLRYAAVTRSTVAAATARARRPRRGAGSGELPVIMAARQIAAAAEFYFHSSPFPLAAAARGLRRESHPHPLPNSQLLLDRRKGFQLTSAHTNERAYVLCPSSSITRSPCIMLRTNRAGALLISISPSRDLVVARSSHSPNPTVRPCRALPVGPTSRSTSAAAATGSRCSAPTRRPLYGSGRDRLEAGRAWPDWKAPGGRVWSVPGVA